MTKQLLYLARGLALLWGGWWTLFGLLSGIGEGPSLEGILRHTLFPGLLFLAFALIACRWSLVGSLFLIVGGLLALAVFPFAWMPAGLLTLTLPPLLAAALLLLAEGQRRLAQRNH